MFFCCTNHKKINDSYCFQRFSSIITKTHTNIQISITLITYASLYILSQKLTANLYYNTVYTKTGYIVENANSSGKISFFRIKLLKFLDIYAAGVIK